MSAELVQRSAAGENAGQLDRGWRGYFTGKTLHITNAERAVLTAR